jgi:hypothetical protein
MRKILDWARGVAVVMSGLVVLIEGNASDLSMFGAIVAEEIASGRA